MSDTLRIVAGSYLGNACSISAAIHVTLGPEVSMHGFSPEAVAIAVRRAIDGDAP